MYRILQKYLYQIPSHQKHARDEDEIQWAVVFKAIPGVLVVSMDHAKLKYGGSPILEWAGSRHSEEAWRAS